MAAAMRCRAHGRLSGETCDIPGCFELVEPDVDSVSGPAEPCSAPECGMAVPCPLHQAETAPDAGHREVAAYLAAADRSAQHDTAPATSAVARLRFPWGPVAVDADAFTVGRDYAAQCGAQIEGFTNVSRLHATITARDGGLFIEDQASTNGTTINGRRILKFQPRPLVDGDVVGFGAHLRAVVDTAEPDT